MGASAWVRFLPSVCTSMRERVLALLRAGELELREAPAGAQGYGLLVCEQIDDSVFDALAESRGAARVLLIAVGRHDWPAARLWDELLEHLVQLNRDQRLLLQGLESSLDVNAGRLARHQEQVGGPALSSLSEKGDDRHVVFLVRW